MNKLFVLINELNVVLKKHLDVKSVFREAERLEFELFDSTHPDKDLLFQASWESFMCNLKMICDEIDIISNENQPTNEVRDAARNVIAFVNEKCIFARPEFHSIDDAILFINTSARLVIFSVNCRVSRKISRLMNKDLQLKDNRVEKCVYRGHSNSSYKLTPSLYRSIALKDKMGVINDQQLKVLYKKAGLLEKYRDVFGTTKVDYNFCAFAQHSKSYSPFLDFTEDYRVALSFATGNTNAINEYMHKEAALYRLSFNDEIEERDSIDLSKLDVFINNARVSPFSSIRGTLVFCCKYSDFSVEAYILKDKTNDRMKYQHGCFLYFQRAVIINGNLLIPMNYGRIEKYTIPAKGNTITKQDIYGTIGERYRYYLQEYLMNPYKYFEEAPL